MTQIADPTDLVLEQAPQEEPQPGRIFAHSALDGLLVLLAVAQIALAVAGVVFFARLPWWALLAGAVPLVLLYPVNSNCISHNFIHNPFFRSARLNLAFDLVNSLAFGLPQTLYHWHHMNHHRWNNDAKAADGKTKDWSSIYRYSSTAGAENVVRYSLLSFPRADFGPVIAVARKKGMGPRLALEFALVLVFFAGLAWASWQGFLAFYLPTWYLGWALSSTENYYRHWGAKPDDRYANAVSSYNRVYNFLTFNNGYHQEHHWRPNVHWTRMHAVYEEFQGDFRAHGTRVIRGPHITAFLEPPP